MSKISTVIQKMECERDESWFMRVAPVDRFFLPTCTSSHTGIPFNTATGASMGMQKMQDELADIGTNNNN